MAEFRDIVFDAFKAARVKTVVEIGAEGGILTSELIEWAKENQGAVWAIDPSPSSHLRNLADQHDVLNLVVANSLDVLPKLPEADCYLVDGDHNYYTVSEELREIVDERTESAQLPLVFLHDVAWPSGRRDQYYAPDEIPESARQSFRYDCGVVPGNQDVVQGGFRGNGEFAVATQEGGPKNGVLTAIEDFVLHHAELEFHVVPAVFGLGVMFPKAGSYASRVRKVLAPYEGNQLLQRLEDNRLALYLKVLELQDVLVERFANERELYKQLEQTLLRVRDKAVENRALRLRQAELDDEVSRLGVANHQKEELRIALGKVLASRSLRLTDAFARIGQVVGRDVGLSRSELRRLFDDTV
jgi:hypothetical protein